jgi:hypothetical protein
MKMPSVSHSVGVKKNRQQISGKLISQFQSWHQYLRLAPVSA